MSEKVTVGELIVRVLEAHDVDNVYGIISIHNLPVADAIGRRNKTTFIPARGEAGALSMADANGRFTGLGVALTSTGAGAGNAVGSLIEACNAASPVLHITGQVEREYLDRDASFIHEAKDQLGFLRASSKAAYRILDPVNACGILREAIRVARTVPMGPVSVEIPIDVQAAEVELPKDLGPVAVPPMPQACEQELTDLLAEIKSAKRPLIWLGGGAIDCVDEVRSLANKGIPIVSSTHGRGILPDSHARSLRAFHNAAPIQQLIKDSDLVLVVGSRLRSNETLTYSLQFGYPMIQVDANPAAQNRNYVADQFIAAEAKQVLSYLDVGLDKGEKIDLDYDDVITQAVNESVQALSTKMENYATICHSLREALPDDGILVRDITMSGSTWGSRLFEINGPNRNIHSLAGAIGLGLAHAIGAALGNPGKKVVSLVGDGGLMLGIGEMATMVQEQTDLVLLVMNDNGYGVMRGIQNNYFDGRQYYNQLHTPCYRDIGKAMGMAAWLVDSVECFESAIKEAIKVNGPAVIEVDMNGIGKLNFAGPPQKKLY